MNKIEALGLLFSIDRQLREGVRTARVVVKNLEKQRASLRREVSGRLLEGYDALMDARRYPPIVEARGAHCGGCNLRLTPQLAHEIRRGESLFPCPHCRRLLFWDARRQEFDAGRPAAVRPGVRRPASVSKSAASLH